VATPRPPGRGVDDDLIAVVRDPDLGPGRCPSCGAPVVWAVDAQGSVLPFDPAPAAPGLGVWELYSEIFPDGTPVDGVQRVRLRPEERPPSSPGWHAHPAWIHELESAARDEWRRDDS
jgi:hypothetical protein